MKTQKLGVIIAVAAVVTLGLSGAAFAFHSGGVAECEGCHTMHNSLNGVSVIEGGTVGVAGPYLLQGTNQSDACLNCHGPFSHGTPASGGYHILSTYQTGTGVSNYTPGGDFAWLTADYSWKPRSSSPTEYSYGYMHGHNVIAGDHGLGPDPRFATSGSPGGGYPAGESGDVSFGCHSCHDPHSKARILTSGNEATTGEAIYSSGSYGADPKTLGTTGFAVGMYRLLGSINYSPASLNGAYAFTQRAMRGAAKSSYNAAEGNINGSRTAYGAYSSEWCSNCHNAMHSTLSTVPGGYVHPTGSTLGASIASNYNAYVKSGTLNPAQTNPYWSIVGFQSDMYGAVGQANGNSQLAAIRDTLAGPSSSDRVSCFSCHRAHASGWDSMTRYPLGNEFTTGADASGNPVYAFSAASGMGRTALEFQSAMHGRPATVFGAYQRALCNKCHAKD